MRKARSLERQDSINWQPHPGQDLATVVERSRAPSSAWQTRARCGSCAAQRRLETQSEL
jgi:hypothetical protein